MTGAAPVVSDESALIADGIAALESLKLARFQVTHYGAGSSQRTIRFNYVYRNEGARSHRVIPLVPMFRRIQNNMRVIDSAGRHLVILDSEITRLIMRGRAHVLRDRIHQLLDEISNGAMTDPIISPDDIDRAFAPMTHYAPRRRDEARTRNQRALDDVLDASLAVIETISENHTADQLRELGVGMTFTDSDSPSTRDSPISRLWEGAAHLLYLVELRYDSYIPFIVTHDEMKPREQEAGPPVFVRQEVFADTDVNDIPGPPHKKSRSVPVESAERESDQVTVRGVQAVKLAAQRSRTPHGIEDWTTTNADDRRFDWFREVFLGSIVVDLELPVVENARSYHVRVATPQGIAHSAPLEAYNFDASAFARDHNGREFASATDESVHIYRTSEMLSEYARQARMNDDPRMKNSLWVRARVKESRGVKEIFWFALIIAVVSAATFRIEVIVLAATAAMTLVAQSTDRALSNHLLARRLRWVAVAGLLAFLAGLKFLAR